MTRTQIRTAWAIVSLAVQHQLLTEDERDLHEVCYIYAGTVLNQMKTTKAAIGHVISSLGLDNARIASMIRGVPE